MIRPMSFTARPEAVGTAPERVGGQDSRDVVLAAADVRSPHRRQPRVDTAHPVCFDHPADHVPGMVLLEAAPQVAHAPTGPRDALPGGLESAFARYAPCGIDTVFTATATATATAPAAPCPTPFR